jgi:hypothetical protein
LWIGVFFPVFSVFDLMKYLQKTIPLGHFTTEDGNVILPRNVGIPLSSDLELYPRRMEPLFTQLWKCQILQFPHICACVTVISNISIY